MGRPGRSVVAGFTALSFFVHGLPALAQDGRELLKRGLAELNRGELDKAESSLEKAAVALLPGPARAQAYLNLGLVRAFQNRFGDAKRDFIKALSDDPRLDVDRERVPPKVSSAFDEARASVTGELIVDGGPSGSTVEIVGQGQWSLPARQRLPVGSYQVRVLDPSGAPLHTEEIAIRAGEKRSLRVVAKVAVAPTPSPVVTPEPRPEPTKPEPAKPEPRRPEPTKPELARPEPTKPEPPLPVAPEAVPEPEPAPPPAPIRPVPRDRPSWFTAMRTAGVTALSTAAVLGFVSMGFGLSARGAEDEFRRVLKEGTFEQAQQLQNDANSRAGLSNLFLGLSVATAAAGLVLVLWPRSESSRSATLVPSGTGVLLSVRY